MENFIIQSDKEQLENDGTYSLDTAFIKEKQHAKKLEAELKTMTILNNRYLKEIKALQRMNEYLTIQGRSSQKDLGKGLDSDKQEYLNQNKLENDFGSFQNSTSYRLGKILVDGMARPGKNTLMMPFRIIRLILDQFFKNRPS